MYSMFRNIDKQRSLLKVLQRLSLDLYDKAGEHSFLPPLEDKGKAGNCPGCGHLMDHYGYMESNKVMIDYCPECNWFWVDPMEFSALAKMYTQEDKVYEHTRVHHSSADIVRAHMDAKVVET